MSTLEIINLPSAPIQRLRSLSPTSLRSSTGVAKVSLISAVVIELYGA